MARIDKKGEGILKQKIKHFYMICYIGVYICYVGDTFYHKCEGETAFSINPKTKTKGIEVAVGRRWT